MTAVLDAGAAIAYLHDEPGAEVVESVILATSSACVMHAVNLYEVYYDFLRRTDGPTALGVVRALRDNGLAVREDLDEALWLDAGRLKVAHSLSVADTFAVALARRLEAELLTTDHHELDAVSAAGECRIRFIR
jgi:PIN domain nuclease of toxin-antitoxin system